MSSNVSSVKSELSSELSMLASEKKTSVCLVNNYIITFIQGRRKLLKVGGGAGFEGYRTQLENILEVLESECKDEMKRVGVNVRETVLKENGEVDNGQPVEIAVSFDGTWAKRGFTSLTGVVFVISLDTGEVLDYHVLSKTCQKCALKKSKCENDNEFEEWKMEHEASNECDINFHGSSPAMEADGAKVL
jgi:hypothetical protein